MTEPVFNKIAIIGAGLIGASIARAAVQYGAAGTVSLYDSSEDVRLRAAGIALGDVADNLATAVAEADCVFLCVPVGALQAVAADAVPLMMAGAVLTDVGSVKGQATEALAAAADGRVHIIPGHPIAGTEGYRYPGARNPHYPSPMAACTLSRATPLPVRSNPVRRRAFRPCSRMPGTF